MEFNIEVKTGKGLGIIVKNGSKEVSIDPNKTKKFLLSYGPEKENYLIITPDPKKDFKYKYYSISLPERVHYELILKEKEVKKETFVIHKNGRRCLKIPWKLSGWELKLTKPTAPRYTIKGTSDGVTAGGDKGGGIGNTRRLQCQWPKGWDDPILLDEALKDIKLNYKLSDEERMTIVQQAIVLIDDFYAHLPLKKAMHAVDPLQRLKLLKYHISKPYRDSKRKLDDRTFHDRMISIFTGLRDLHTAYILPYPYRVMVAYLPFLIEEFYDGEGEHLKRKYMVSKIYEDSGFKELKEEDIITHWNGIPMDKAVALNGERNAGSNKYARHARGLERMTIRPLMISLPPDEKWVIITYQRGNNKNITDTEKIYWKVKSPPPIPDGSGVESSREKVNSALGIDMETEIVGRTKKELFLKKNEQKWGGNTALASWEQSKMPDVFAYGKTTDGKYGYIRIYTFNVNDSDKFVGEFVRIAKLFPKDCGLIIDVRGNGGGLVTAGEKLLKVFPSETKIEPERFHFINTPLTLELCRRYEWLSDWASSIERSIETGAIYSQGFTLEPVGERKPIEQKDIVLITDALCYSTTDIFAAGFKDHGIGKILGIHGNTGAGGANVWSHQLLRMLLPKDSPIEALPRYSDFRVAIRRTTRVGKKIGMPLEDLGVEPDCIHHMTNDDLLHHNKDLIGKAVGILAEPEKCNKGETV